LYSEKREHLSKKPEKQVEKKTETRGTPSTSSKACLNLMIWLTKTNRILLQSMVYDCLFPYVHRIDQLAILWKSHFLLQRWRNGPGMT